MKRLYSIDAAREQTKLLTPETGTARCPEQLEVNVISTEKQATATVLKSAESLASGLGACIRIRATIVVPFRLPLEQPPVSVQFTERLLCNLAGQSEGDEIERTIHVYVCRDRLETILQVLKPNSLVLIGGRRRWWPTGASRMARKLQARGHRVISIDVRA